MTTILTDTGANSVDTARAAGDDLWLPAADLPRACGWILKPEGLCQGEMCVPLPRVARERYLADGAVNLAAFWRLLGRPVLHDASGSTWMLGAAASDRGR
ncbi:MAG: redoxin domain-containing (seleno)protein, partial [Gammaproteobacteria bacterium]